MRWDSDTLRFMLVAACVLVAFIQRGDWYLLIAMVFTTVADAFLLLLGWHEAGVAVFVFAHIAYIRRANRNWKWARLYPLTFLAPVVLLLLKQPSLLALSVLYGQSILWAAAATLRAWKAGRKPRVRWACAALGMALFVGCDICVVLYNLDMAGIHLPALSRAAGDIIWVFYAPSQALLAVSAGKWKVLLDEERRG